MATRSAGSMWGRRVGKIMFLIGLVCVCFRRPIAQGLVAALQPAAPTVIMRPMQHPVDRYELYTCVAGFALILGALVVFVVTVALTGSWGCSQRDRKSDGQEPHVRDDETVP